MRSLEELQTVLISTFSTLMELDTRERLNGGWLIHITEQLKKPKKKKGEKVEKPYYKVYVEKDAFDKILGAMEDAFAQTKEESAKSPQAIRTQLFKLGIITDHKAACHSRAYKGAPYTEHKCVVFRRDALDWILDMPLHAGEKGKTWKNNA